MGLLAASNGERLALEYLVNKTQPQDLVLRLYANDVTPEKFDTANTYQEPRGHGYFATTLKGADWVVKMGDRDKPTMAEFPQRTFTFTGPIGKVYGYFMTRLKGDLVWAERFATGPFDIRNEGDQIRIVPRIEYVG